MSALQCVMTAAIAASSVQHKVLVIPAPLGSTELRPSSPVRDLERGGGYPGTSMMGLARLVGSKKWGCAFIFWIEARQHALY
eukprot:scaffold39288_cov18-Tisochrysis_lutea.AAC.1